MDVPEAETVAGLIRNAYPSFALLAGMQLGVFNTLADGPMDAQQIAERIKGSSERLSPLLYALVATGLLRVEDGRFVNGSEAQRFLVETSPDYVGNLHLLLSDLWSATLKTADSIRRDQPQAEHSFADMPIAQLYAFLLGLHHEALATGRDLAARFDFSAFRRLLDVGGGSGGLAIAAAEACPNLTATVLDLPEVVPLTRRFIRQANATERVRTLALDVTREPVPEEFDAAVAKAFVQTLAPDQAGPALSHIGAALRPGGSIYILRQRHPGRQPMFTARSGNLQHSLPQHLSRGSRLHGKRVQNLVDPGGIRGCPSGQATERIKYHHPAKALNGLPRWDLTPMTDSRQNRVDKPWNPDYL